MDTKPIRVLIASDGSPSAERAIALVECVSWPRGTKLRIITVAAPMPAALVAEMSRAGTEAESQVRSVGGYDVEVVLRVGRAASHIVDEAKDWQAELVVLGSRGLGPLGSAFLGSVAAEVVDHAPCAVLIARTVCAKNVLFADDGSETAADAAAFLARVPALGDRELRVLSVAHVQAPLDSGIAPHLRELARHEHAELVNAAREQRDQLAVARARSFVRPGGRVSHDVRVGDPAKELLSEAAEHHTDLIVLGSHGRTGLERLLLGSVARKVLLHAACSVLIVRGRAA